MLWNWEVDAASSGRGVEEDMGGVCRLLAQNGEKNV